MQDVLAPSIQYGFAGFSVVLLGIVVWQIRELLKLTRAFSAAMQRNADAFTRFERAFEKFQTVLSGVDQTMQSFAVESRQVLKQLRESKP